jgi:hypothetical protein
MERAHIILGSDFRPAVFVVAQLFPASIKIKIPTVQFSGYKVSSLVFWFSFVGHLVALNGSSGADGYCEHQ